MRIELTLKNYRCFPDSSPAKIVIDDDWTALVGVNNVGKSALLRFFYEFRNLFANLREANTWRNLALKQPLEFSYGDSVRDHAEVFHSENQRDLSIEFRVVNADTRSLRAQPLMSATFAVRPQTARQVALTDLRLPDGSVVPLGGVDLADNTVLVREGVRVDVSWYLSAVQRLSRTLYVGAFRNVLNTGAKANYFDIQVGDAFVKRWREMQTGNNKQASIACGQVVASIERIFGIRRLEIQASHGDDTLQIVINHRPYKLHELGAGLAQFILVLANAAVSRPTYILIDEPELNLHPSLQLDFLTALASFAEHGLVFTTHSLGLARATADRIFSVLRVDDGVSKVVPYEATPNLPEFLGALSYSSYQAIGFSKVLLVEGTTEVRAIQQYLRKLGKDHQILLVPLSGSSMIKANCEHELSELKRIATDIFALVDSEKASAAEPLSADRTAFQTTCQKLGIRCHVLERRALENYMTDAAIKQVKGQRYRQLAPYEALKAADPCWGKHENWRIAAEMKWEDVKDTDLGRFLESL